MARARPRSNTPTFGASCMALSSTFQSASESSSNTRMVCSSGFSFNRNNLSLRYYYDTL